MDAAKFLAQPKLILFRIYDMLKHSSPEFNQMREVAQTLASGSAMTLHTNSDLTPGAAWTHGRSTSISGETENLILQQ
jgi:hypothetical protein